MAESRSVVLTRRRYYGISEISDTGHRIQLCEFYNGGAQYCGFFIYNREQMDFSAKSVAGKLFVSEASLSRFAKKCGFRGYREFIYQYEENFVVRQDSMTGNTRTVLNAYQELLNKTYNLVNEKQIERVCRYMAKAGRVFVCGTGSSGLAAREMELRFMRIGLDITPWTTAT